MTPPRTESGVDITLLEPDNAARLATFASMSPLTLNDFASIASTTPPQTRVWMAEIDRTVIAAAIDDGLALAVAGSVMGLQALGGAIPGIPNKLVISGRTDECRAFVAPFSAGRHERPESFMAVDAATLRIGGPTEVELRIAVADDLPLLAEARTRALEEEYKMTVPRGGSMARELRSAVERAVQLQGVAIWIEDGHIAFTAQLISKTPAAAMFGDLYTDPALRGAGRATAALGVFCRWLMTESERVTLRVGRDNLSALRLYERVGFGHVDEFVSSLGAQPS